jgi:hypothetical protein
MLKSKPGSTARLLELCAGYFLSYVVTGVLVKFFTGNLNGTPRMSDIAYLANNTVGGNLLCLAAVLALGWIPWPWKRGGRWPSEMPYILASGVCTAVIIPGTTLLYTLPISVMVAMVIMRGSIIVISRIIDAVQIRQGILKRKVYAEENWAVVFALVAVGANLLPVPMAPWFEAHPDIAHALGIAPAKLRGGFDFVHNTLAIWTLGAYITAYAIRLYLMNYFKNTRKGPSDVNNTAYFAIEQISASAVIFGAMALIWFGVRTWGWADPRLVMTHEAVGKPDLLAIASGLPYGLVAFFSVFLFMFQGRTATFAGLVNRITSLLAGTTATLILAWLWHQKPPAVTEWVSFLFILVAVGFLSRAEMRRAAEVAAAAAQA